MPETLDSFPKAHRGRPPIYPWDEWADGQVRRLVQGEDFHTPPASFRALVHRTATARGARGDHLNAAKTRIPQGSNSVIVQFYHKDDE